MVGLLVAWIGRIGLRRGLLLAGTVVCGFSGWYLPWQKWLYDLRYPLPVQAYQVYEDLWADALALRAKDGSDEEWNALNLRAQSGTKPLLDRLRKTAGSSDRAAQQLVWAGRDCLLPAISSRGKWDETQAAAFEEHMANARKALDGAKLDYGATERRQFLRKWIPVEDDATVSNEPWTPGVMEVFITVDVAIAV